MLYRKLGKTGCDVSVLGFGCMRLPVIDRGETGSDARNAPIDEDLAVKMIRHGIAQGINYFDTAWFYHGGKSEIVLGKAIKQDRRKVMLATKLPARIIKDADEFDTILHEQLNKLDTDYFDFYLLHGLNRSIWPKVKEMGVLKFLDKIIEDGLVKYAGFSFHDNINVFKEIVDSYDWSLCQFQYNYYDENYQAGREGLEYASEKGLGIVIMEPLRGGKLANDIPDEIQAIWDTAEIKRTPAEWGLRWVWNQPGVSMVLSGMSTMSQVIENIRTADDAEPDSLSKSELSLIGQVKEKYQQMLKVDCTTCAYCMPCPNDVDIPLNLTIYNDSFVFKDLDRGIMRYNNMLTPERRASNCIECGECEEKCPQEIKIIDELKNVHQRLAT
ncbi:aldo/keto reductase [Thermodesulfobacteriota bacterium]